MKEYNIAVSASNTYAKYISVMISSFYEKHPDSLVNLYIFYIDDRVLKTERILKKIPNSNNQNHKISFIKVDSEKLNLVDNKKGWAIDLWSRWYLFDYLKDKCDRVLILGVDTMIKENIDNFYFQNLNGFYFSCCPDMLVSNSDLTNFPDIRSDMIRMNFGDKTKYINADVVLVNLEETRNNVSFEGFLKLYKEYQFTCWDQCLITYCFNDKIKFDDNKKYNYMPNLGILDFNNNTFRNAKIIHFAGYKPWNTPICEAKKFVGISDWYDQAIKVSLISKYSKVICYIFTPYRRLKEFLKQSPLLVKIYKKIKIKLNI